MNFVTVFTLKDWLAIGFLGVGLVIFGIVFAIHLVNKAIQLWR